MVRAILAKSRIVVVLVAVVVVVVQQLTVLAVLALRMKPTHR
jgi:hypothetical protein